MTSPNTEPPHVFERVRRVEIDQRRWYAAITLHHEDGSPIEMLACADGEHSGLWLGDPADHEEH